MRGEFRIDIKRFKLMGSSYKPFNKTKLLVSSRIQKYWKWGGGGGGGIFGKKNSQRKASVFQKTFTVCCHEIFQNFQQGGLGQGPSLNSPWLLHEAILHISWSNWACACLVFHKIIWMNSPAENNKCHQTYNKSIVILHISSEMKWNPSFLLLRLHFVNTNVTLTQVKNR